MATIPALAHTQNAFIWRFIIVNPSDYRVVHVVASTEREARNYCPSGCVAGDNVPPVWLGDQQLAELENLNIIDDGRYCVRLYKAGHIKPSNINTGERRPGGLRSCNR